MKFSIEQDDDIAIFTLKSSTLDANISGDLKSEFLIICQPNLVALIIDLSYVEFMDSAGISSLLIAERQMAEHEAPVVIVGANEHIQTTLRISQLDRVFELVPTTEEALQMLRSPATE